MAEGKSKKKKTASKNMTNCIVVKFKDSMNIPYVSGDEWVKYLSGDFEISWAAILKKHPDLIVKRLITSITPVELDLLMAEAKENANQYNKIYIYPNFHNFFSIEYKGSTATRGLLKSVQNLECVEYAYIQQRIVTASKSVRKRSYSGKQKYLDAAPIGIDARFAWTQAGGKGQDENVSFIHIEGGWDTHPDLQDWATTPPIIPLHGVNVGTKPHGTNVLGVIMAQDNNFGVTGITPYVQTSVVSLYNSDPPGNPEPVNAIMFAISKLKSGDIILITFQGKTLLPAESEPAIFEAIQCGTMKGIIIVEVAGNGGNNLDAHKRFNKNSQAGYKDSGAIMVGSAESAKSHKKTSASNFGTRIDCYAWGEKIATTGPNNGYNFDFGRTCGAATIIAGAAISVQSMYKAKNDGKILHCQEMRGILSLKDNGTSSPDLIGVMPDLKKIYQKL